MNLTLQEWIILIIAIIVIVSIIVSVIKASIKLAIIALVALLLFTGFTFVPEFITRRLGVSETAENYQNQMGPYNPVDTQDAQDLVNTIGNTADKAKDYVVSNKDSWINSAKSLWYKITHIQQPENIGG